MEICIGCGVRVMVFNATFNNILVILWWSVLLMEESGVPGENHHPVAGVLDTTFCDKVYGQFTRPVSPVFGFSLV